MFSCRSSSRPSSSSRSTLGGLTPGVYSKSGVFFFPMHLPSKRPPSCQSTTKTLNVNPKQDKEVEKKKQTPQTRTLARAHNLPLSLSLKVYTKTVSTTVEMVRRRLFFFRLRRERRLVTSRRRRRAVAFSFKKIPIDWITPSGFPTARFFW